MNARNIENPLYDGDWQVKYQCVVLLLASVACLSSGYRLAMRMMRACTIKSLLAMVSPVLFVSLRGSCHADDV